MREFQKVIKKEKQSSDEKMGDAVLVFDENRKRGLGVLEELMDW